MVAARKNDPEFLELWLAGRPAATRAAYSRDVEIFREAVRKPLHEVEGQDLVQFVAGLRGSAATRARRIASVKSLFSFGARLGLVPSNPTVVIRSSRAEGAVHERILTEEEVTVVINEAPPGRDRCLVRTLYLAGLRIAEAVSIRFCDLARQWITVRGKGGRTRTVAVPMDLVEDLRRLRWRTDVDDAPVFKSRGGCAISTRFARRIVQSVSEEALGKTISPHWLRHSHATHALERGAPIHLVQAALGHRSLATTAIYLHVRPGRGSSQYLVAGNARLERARGGGLQGNY